MADQDQVPQGAIPPKVTPFAKPEGVSPITPAVPGAPRPITVRLRPATAAPGAAPVATPGAAPVAAPAAPAVGIPTPPSAHPRSTSRVPVPEAVVAVPVPVAPSAPTASSTAATVRLRPVAAPSAPAPAHAAGSTQAIAPMNPPAAAAASTMQPQHPPTPGSNPLPSGPKPPSGAQVQAAKSKTSRISLDSAIGVAPMTPMSGDKAEPKTIRLKRPTDLAAPTAKSGTSPIRQTSRIPDSALPNMAAAPQPDSASVTQKKTLKIKRPGMKEDGAAASAEGEAFPEGVQMTPVGAVDASAKQEPNKGFTAVAVFAASVAAILLLLLTLCLAAHAVGPVSGPNALAFATGPELPWPGRLAN